jgi:predicted TPR repeat methyltransferase
VKSVNKVWASFKYNPLKSLQENVGFSHREDVEKAIAIIHDDLKKLYFQNENKIKAILDLGCGTGLYLKDFENYNCSIYGLDLSEELLKAASKHVNKAKVICGSYMNLTLPAKMNFIYSISVMEYISRNDLRSFFKKLHNDLESDGLVFIQYPHALSFLDSCYPELNYIKYSPKVVEKCASQYFDILRHSHGYQNDKIVGKYDKEPFLIAGGSFVNGYVLIGKKRK